jgi:hypothetical protein
MMAKSKARPKARPGAKAKRTNARRKAGGEGDSTASRRIDEKIRSLNDWRGETLAEVRRIIHEADPEIVEEVKWVKPTNSSGVPVWSHAGLVCTAETYKEVVKLTFARGASLPDPKRLFNSSLEGNTRRAIDIREGETLDAEALAALIQAAVAENLRVEVPASAGLPDRLKAGLQRNSPPKAAAKTKAASAKAKPVEKKPKPVKLLSGGNPQIAKGYGDAPVQAYIAAMPGWKQGVGRRLDALITRTVPRVYKAVKWNTPFYGVEEGVWFLGFHCLTKYIKVAFFRGTSLRPVPPVESKQKEVRYFHIYENLGAPGFDEAQFAAWVKQASQLPGEKM